MVKSIILEAGEFQKEICHILLTSEKDEELEVVACKAIGNFIIDTQKSFVKEE